MQGEIPYRDIIAQKKQHFNKKIDPSRKNEGRIERSWIGPEHRNDHYENAENSRGKGKELNKIAVKISALLSEDYRQDNACDAKKRREEKKYASCDIRDIGKGQRIAVSRQEEQSQDAEISREGQNEDYR